MKQSNKTNVHFCGFFGSILFILCMVSLIYITLLVESLQSNNYNVVIKNVKDGNDSSSEELDNTNVPTSKPKKEHGVVMKNVKDENDSSSEELDNTNVPTSKPKKKLSVVFKENKKFFQYLINEDIYAEYELVPTNKEHTKYSNENDKALNYELESIKKSNKNRYERMYQLWTRIVQNEENKYILSVSKMFEVFNFIVNFYSVHYLKEEEIMNELRTTFTDLYRNVTPNMNDLFIRWITDNDVLNHGEFALLVDGNRYVWRNLLKHLEIAFKEIITKHFRYQLRSFELERNLIVCEEKSNKLDNINFEKNKKSKKSIKKKNL
ncbi:Plasmodium exported protein (PHISTb), unknown function [Plasmodium reichenowi]|uniref:Plasmodium RESA N-terminal domain-containing protein n=2 Tax=Plasmodium reichenowi TaxID=5854 RepID=A0A060RWA7_PLARE|nr:Plasmodium exported protein (PHISTb), unknown function [Plasmodium reichenowi]